MNRRLVIAAGALAASAAFAAPAGAYPEQPGNHVQTACGQITTNAATTVAGPNRPAATDARLTALVVDACFGGP